MIGLNPDAYQAIWPWAQYNGQVVMDANGNLTVSYEGFGPDVAETGYSGAGITSVYQMLDQPQNADLLTLWNNVGGFPQPNDGYNDGDPDSMIEEVLIRAQDLGATNDQLGRLDAIMNQVLTLNRGEANGIMYAQFDADPANPLGPENLLESDNVVNGQRDGTNQRILIVLTKDITSGSFTVRVTNGPNHQDITITPVYTTGDNPVIDQTQTTSAILTALQACVKEVGINWPTKDNQGSWLGPVTVRLLSDQEVQEREGSGATGTNGLLGPVKLRRHL